MDNEYDKPGYLKIIFSLISLFLMIPLLIDGDINYHRTLFIFLINRIIDMSFIKEHNEETFFVVWALINQWTGVLACAFAFCLIEPDFASVCTSYSVQINIALFVSALSCVLKEMIVLIVVSVKENLIKKKMQEM